MLDVLRGDDVEISLSLGENPSAEPGAFRRKERGDRHPHYVACANDFMDVCVRVTNNACASLSFSPFGRVFDEWLTSIVQLSPSI